MKNCTRCGTLIVQGGTEDGFGRCPSCQTEVILAEAAHMCAYEGCTNPVLVDCDLCNLPICEVHTTATVCIEVCPNCLPKVREGEAEVARADPFAE